ncbi:MAG: ATP-binding cassette domain-containing protein, partial [Caldilineaceae bacterium]|nr:ATP-binding cassette domain-containing protein [Caldilineaceae bacterium]
MPGTILQANNLVKKYGDLIAVNDVSFAIEEGEVFGLLGPNGAGKSTTIAMLSGLFPPTGGSATIGGLDVVRELGKVKQIIGVVPQDLALYPTLNARENVGFFGELYGLRGKALHARVDEVLGYVGMLERAKDQVKTYSGGMKRRVNLAAGLVNHPRLLFLDEPTVGVDPQSRNQILESIDRLGGAGLAVLYTTHYM